MISRFHVLLIIAASLLSVAEAAAQQPVQEKIMDTPRYELGGSKMDEWPAGGQYVMLSADLIQPAKRNANAQGVDITVTYGAGELHLVWVFV